MNSFPTPIGTFLLDGGIDGFSISKIVGVAFHFFLIFGEEQTPTEVLTHDVLKFGRLKTKSANHKYSTQKYSYINFRGKNWRLSFSFSL